MAPLFKISGFSRNSDCQHDERISPYTISARRGRLLAFPPLLASVLLVFIVTSLLVKRFWCKYLCPLGAMLVVFNKISPLRVVIDRDRCTHCNRCQAECPVGIPGIPENIRSAECVRCLECLETCVVPDAVTLRVGCRGLRNHPCLDKGTNHPPVQAHTPQLDSGLILINLGLVISLGCAKISLLR